MNTIEKNRPIVKDLLKCDELRYQFEDVICIDDSKEVWEYTDQEIIEETKYVKTKYEAGNGWTHYDEIIGKWNKDDIKVARKEYNQIKRFLKKWGEE